MGAFRSGVGCSVLLKCCHENTGLAVSLCGTIGTSGVWRIDSSHMDSRRNSIEHLEENQQLKT